LSQDLEHFGEIQERERQRDKIFDNVVEEKGYADSDDLPGEHKGEHLKLWTTATY
jgi:hypothetical protein